MGFIWQMSQYFLTIFSLWSFYFLRKWFVLSCALTRIGLCIFFFFFSIWFCCLYSTFKSIHTYQISFSQPFVLYIYTKTLFLTNEEQWGWFFSFRYLTFIPLRDLVHYFWSSSLECRGQQNFSERGQIGNISSFAGCVVHVYNTALVALKQHILYVNKCSFLFQ